MRSSSSAMSRSTCSRRAASGRLASRVTAMRIRASGERSSCEAAASNVRWPPTSCSMRSAARLKLRASSATSSPPSTSTRVARSPAPSWSTRAWRRSRRRVMRRATGCATSASTRRKTASGSKKRGPPRGGGAALNQRPSGSSSESMRWRRRSPGTRVQSPDGWPNGGGPSRRPAAAMKRRSDP